MQCTNPVVVTLNRPKSGRVAMKGNEDRVLRAPCGHCLACRIQRTREWATRLYHEASEWEKTGFLTLTYDDEHLPWKGSLFPRDWQTFMKRLRKDYGLPVKYYMCGEYGPLHLRPHFHAVMYGLSRAEQDLVKNAWGKGRVGIGMITYDACAYVASYVNGKKYGGELAKSRLGNLLPEFQLLSKGIGERWCIANENYLKWNQLVTVKGKPVGIPRYYVKKLELDITARNDKLNDETRQKNELVQEKYNFRIPWDYQKKTNAQRALNIQAKQDLRERKDI